MRRASSCRQFLLALPLLLAGCSDGDLRGKSVPSTDGGTYLAIDDDNGGGCGPLMVDGRDWTTPLHVSGKIEPGTHVIQCGPNDPGIQVDVKAGTSYHFDYWGP